jgi:hypothetical protein
VILGRSSSERMRTPFYYVYAVMEAKLAKSKMASFNIIRFDYILSISKGQK